MEKKTIRFDLSADTLLDLADARLEEGDHLAALRMLHKSVDLYGPGADEYAALADVYDEMELFELSAECWFRYLDVCAEEEAVDAYEGLAACYYNLGNERLASYYYKKMLNDKFVSPANNVEMGELLERPPRPQLKIAWPPESADYSQEIDAGLRALKEGNYDEAEKQFRKVNEKSEYYPSALNYLSVNYLLAGKPAEAEATCKQLIERDPDNIQALSTYAAVLTEQDRKAEGRAVAEKLASLPAKSADELYKTATVCCENGLYEQAYEKFCKLETMVSYDRTLLYFKAVAALRCGRTNDSLAALGKILDIQPRAAVVRYYYREIQRYAKEGGTMPETTFFCHVPQAERETRIALLTELSKMKAGDVRAYFEAEKNADELLEWCFDEADGRDAELQVAAVAVAIRAGRDGFVCDLLVDPKVNDIVKIETVQRLCLRNKGLEFGIVIADIYRKVCFDRLEVGREKHAKFVAAYALCFARLALLGEGDAEHYRFAAQAIYATLEKEGELSLVKDAESLACAMFLTAVATGQADARRVLQRMNADAENVAQILNVLHGAFEKEQAEVAAASAEKTSPQADSPSETEEELSPNEDGQAEVQAKETSPKEEHGEETVREGTEKEDDPDETH